MVIDRVTYPLFHNNFVMEASSKDKIMLVNTFGTGMNHYEGWKTRRGGKYKSTTAYTIDRDGSVYEHFDPNYHGKVFDKKVDTSLIVISMVNMGYLTLDKESNEYLTWLGDIYKGKDVVDRRWRGHRYWEAYTKEQQDSVVELLKFLCDKFTIGNNVVGHNTKVEALNTFSGILCRSNFDKHYSDLSPAWDFEQLKENMVL